MPDNPDEPDEKTAYNKRSARNLKVWPKPFVGSWVQPCVGYDRERNQNYYATVIMSRETETDLYTITTHYEYGEPGKPGYERVFQGERGPAPLPAATRLMRRECALASNHPDKPFRLTTWPPGQNKPEDRDTF